ncbi:hypothetical protein DFR52_104570 [Hoeflea marina]|uniref:Uncharacterized protein n=1 Tax=Hoeflea marina TaxID=274592 RepID=A0A317PH57_9HYPH|nr:hypothetical protein [Hoeflea marina]PWV99276.1 hypothetical protein DFR52_104570 [Hoeflea marina]
MPKLIRFLLLHTGLGVAVGWLIAAGLVWFNINGFGDLVLGSSSRVAAVFILMVSFGSTFGFAAVATGVMLMPTDKDEFDRL